MSRVLLISMPFSPISTPSPALGLLKALLEREQVGCDVRYFNLAFQAYAGFPEICNFLAEHFGIGEWPFSGALFGSEWADSPRSRIDSLDPSCLWPPLQPGASTEWIRDGLTFLRSMAEPFLRQCMDSVDWEEYSIVGFTSVFSQNVASLALARLIKERWPEKIIAFGGANCDGQMSRGLLRHFPFVDWAFVGEADVSFPRAVSQWLTGSPPEGIPGVAYRHGEEIRLQSRGEPVDLDSLPYPDFGDYFAAVERWAPHILPSVFLSLEFSRGCWWGQKSQCAFCGVNGGGLHFRRKSPRRVQQEVQAAVARYGVHTVVATDAILDMEYFKTLLPALSNCPEIEALGFEIKANLNREQVKSLREARAQLLVAGIESLDTEILTRMRKGITLLQNVQLLKWAREYGVEITWHFLYGLPGETAEAYARMARLIPSLTHLSRPRILPIVLHHFSPLYEQKESWQIRNVRALDLYRMVYPFEQEELDELAYAFECDFDGRENIAAYFQPVKQEIEAWQELRAQSEPPILAYARRQDGRIVIYDSRPSRDSPEIFLEEEASIAYLGCDARRQFDSLASDVREKAGKGYSGDTQLRRCLDDLVDRRLMLREDDWYLSLANDLTILNEHAASPMSRLLVLINEMQRQPMTVEMENP